MNTSYDLGGQPPPLSPPAAIQARNNEQNLDLTGRVTNLDEHSLVVSFPVEIPAGTVLFATLELRRINALVRGLIRVRSQDQGTELGGLRTVADFVDLNKDERNKILRLLEEPDVEPQAAAPAHVPARAQGQNARARDRAVRPRRASGYAPSISIASMIWFLLGLIFYSCVALAIIAIFPEGRHMELVWLAKILHSLKLS